MRCESLDSRLESLPEQGASIEMFVVILVVIDDVSEPSAQKFDPDACFRTVWLRDGRLAPRFPSLTNAPFRNMGTGGASGMLRGPARGLSCCASESEAEEDEGAKKDAGADVDETVVEE